MNQTPHEHTVFRWIVAAHPDSSTLFQVNVSSCLTYCQVVQEGHICTASLTEPPDELHTRSSLRLHQSVFTAILHRVDLAVEIDEGGASHSAHRGGGFTPDGDAETQVEPSKTRRHLTRTSSSPPQV